MPRDSRFQVTGQSFRAKLRISTFCTGRTVPVAMAAEARVERRSLWLIPSTWRLQTIRVLRRAATNGIPGTSMPAFAQSAGGMLTDKQIDVIVNGIRERWSQPECLPRREPAAVLIHRVPATLRADRRSTHVTALPAMARPAAEDAKGEFDRGWIVPCSTRRSRTSDNCDCGAP